MSTRRRLPPRPDYLNFAERRPRHYALIFSGQFSDHTAFPAMRDQHYWLVATLKDVLSREIGREAEPGEIHVFWATIHGSASIIAANMPPQNDALLDALERHCESLRATGPARPSSGRGSAPPRRPTRP